MTSLPFVSHFLAQLPLADALRDAGHDVRFATSGDLAATVDAARFERVNVIFKAGPGVEELSLRNEDGSRPVHVWMPTAARVAPALLRAFEAWRPEVVIRDPLDFGSCLAAERAGLPHAVGREGPFLRPEDRQNALGTDLDELRQQLDLPPDPETEMLYRYLALVFAPPQLLPAGLYVPPVSHFIRPAPIDDVFGVAFEPWVPPASDRPFVYATLGTVFNSGHFGLLQTMARALANRPYDALVTCGPRTDLRSFDWAADISNITVKRFVPQSRVLPHCDVMLAHGGFHSVMGALVHGVPMVLLPLGGDHHRNAQWCADNGAALVLEDSARDVENIARAIRQVMSNPSYSWASQRLQTAIDDLPPISRAVELVEILAATKAPLRRQQVERPLQP
ncbi:MAG TPA: glycosyltransferase [Acidimicrobiales bacterium]|nr:glycosyltransferase [Acidimicrobiales bacterium]